MFCFHVQRFQVVEGRSHWHQFGSLTNNPYQPSYTHYTHCIPEVRLRFLARDLHLMPTADLTSHSSYTQHAIRTDIALECMGTAGFNADELAFCFDLAPFAYSTDATRKQVYADLLSHPKDQVCTSLLTLKPLFKHSRLQLLPTCLQLQAGPSCRVASWHVFLPALRKNELWILMLHTLWQFSPCQLTLLWWWGLCDIQPPPPTNDTCVCWGLSS